jgi:hypothetical protein
MTVYFPVAPRTGKLAGTVLPPARLSVTGTDCPGFIIAVGAMHIR